MSKYKTKFLHEETKIKMSEAKQRIKLRREFRREHSHLTVTKLKELLTNFRGK